VITLKAGGLVYSGWTEIEVNRSMENLSGYFSISLTDKSTDNIKKLFTVKSGDACQVSVNGKQVLDGYVDKIKPKYDANSHSITLSGRDRAADLVDCAVINGTGQWKGLKLEQIIAEICKPFKIKVTANFDTGAAIGNFAVDQGMTAFEAIQKLCAFKSCLAISDNVGGILLTRASTEVLSTPLIEGGNILSAEAEYDASMRYSEYIVKGQSQGDDFIGLLNSTGAKAIVKDENVTRYRPIVIVLDAEMTRDKALLRARWEAAVKHGKARVYTIVVNGWEQKDKKLWDINKLVRIKSPMLGIDENLIIAGLIYKLDDGGETTEIALTDPKAYQVLKEDIIKKGSESKTNKYIFTVQ
jgi:prophage tail gpP-like protein